MLKSMNSYVKKYELISSVTYFCAYEFICTYSYIKKMATDGGGGVVGGVAARPVVGGSNPKIFFSIFSY